MGAISYRFLTEADFNPLHQTFLAAFSDYQVDMQVSAEQMRQRLIRDGVQLELSVGAFDGTDMVGFSINGYGSWQGHPTAYDAGTGIVPTYRGRGIGKELFNFMIPHLKASGVYQCLLEVISSNLPALTLYRKLGFKETRTLDVMRSELTVRQSFSSIAVEIREIVSPDWSLYQSFWDGYPSWQNSIESIERMVGRHFVGAYFAGQCIGYGVFSPFSGNVMQLAVSRHHRRKRVGSLILADLQSKAAGEGLKVTNIDFELKATLAFYRANGFKLVLQQLEMMKHL